MYWEKTLSHISETIEIILQVRGDKWWGGGRSRGAVGESPTTRGLQLGLQVVLKRQGVRLMP
jgi:hypothetical protein